MSIAGFFRKKLGGNDTIHYFCKKIDKNIMSQPLAERLRPKTLDDYIG